MEEVKWMGVMYARARARARRETAVNPLCIDPIFKAPLQLAALPMAGGERMDLGQDGEEWKEGREGDMCA